MDWLKSWFSTKKEMDPFRKILKEKKHWFNKAHAHRKSLEKYYRYLQKQYKKDPLMFTGTIALPTVAFPALLYFGQAFVLFPLRISCATPFASIPGAVITASAGVCSSALFMLTPFAIDYVRNLSKHNDKEVERLRRQVLSVYEKCKKAKSVSPAIEGLHLPKVDVDEWVFYAGATMLTFWMLGGRFKNVCPSDLCKPGAFARKSIPAPSTEYATQAEKTILNKIGRKYGCHSCGRRANIYYHGDHMPPNKYANGRTQVFLPQCSTCSNLQGSACAYDIRRLKMHASLRLYHLWLPHPLLAPIVYQYWESLMSFLSAFANF